MAEIVIAAAEGDVARANAFAEALKALGFDVAAQASAPAELARTVEDCKCVLALWSTHVGGSWIVALSTLALDRKKLLSAEITTDATPAPFKAAPKVKLDARDRVLFKDAFAALMAELEKFELKPGKAEAMPDALAKARIALTARNPQGPRRNPWTLVGLAGVTMVALFAVGVGASRMAALMKQGGPMLAPAHASTEATPTRLVLQPGYGLTEAQLETLPWRDAAARIQAPEAARIKADAANGVAFAQSLACLGHMAGAPGFLPSPTAASGFCDQASAQNDRAGLYLSWTLRRTMPNAAISESVARDRLAQAARLGLTAAQVDYALSLAPDGHTPMQAQEEAGRLLLAAAEKDDPRGQYYYARWLRDSPAGPRDPSAAIPFLQRAADAGQPDALHLLGTFYRDGAGVTRDLGKARELYGRAAAENYPPSMFNLADLERGVDDAHAAQLYSQLACMRDEHQISAMATRRLHAMGQAARCS
ncbi:MAG: hypothetical protein QM759_01425 [Terricaulis sp.]